MIFYLSSFVFIAFQNWFLYSPEALLIFNATLLIPQIAKNFANRSRRGPTFQLALSLCAVQSFMPIYLCMCPSNFMEHETDPITGIYAVLVMGASLLVLMR